MSTHKIFSDDKLLVGTNKLVTSYYHEGHSIIISEWQGAFVNEPAKEIFEIIRGFTKTHVVKGIFNDCNKMKGTFTGLNDYFETEWQPDMMKYGFRAWLCTTRDAFTKFSVNDMIKRQGERPIKAKFFGDTEMDEAMEWLLETIKQN
jgi:hypothetical protein